MSDRMVVCPNCDCQGVYPRYVYGKAKTKVSIEEDYEIRKQEFGKSYMAIGTISSFGPPIPIQVVYQCDHCGYTKVIEVKC